LFNAEAINPATDDFVHSVGSQLVQSLWEIEMTDGQLFSLDHLSILNGNDQHLGREIEAGGNTASK
jgi:hypothetical protein